MAAGEGGVISGKSLRSPLMPSGWGRDCDDRRLTALRGRDEDGGDERGLLGRDKTVGGVATMGMCALHLPKRTWIVKFDGKPIGYFYIEKVWDASHRCYPLCTCSNGDIVVPSDAFGGYSVSTTRRSNQINCWRFYPLTENSSVRSILTGSDYPIFLRQELEQRQEWGEIPPGVNLDEYMEEFAQYISESGAGDATLRTVNVDFAYSTTVMIDKDGNGIWLGNGNRSLYGIFAPAFFENYRIYPFDEDRRNTWVTVDGRHFCVGLRYRDYYASALSPQGYKTVHSSFREFNGEDERRVAFHPSGSTFATYETKTGRGEHGWEISYINYPAGHGVLNIAFRVPVAGTYTSGYGLVQFGQFFYNELFDVRELNNHSGSSTGTDYVLARFSVEYDVKSLEIERFEGMPRENEDVTQEWFSSGGRYLGTETTTTTYPQGIESHITFERL